MKLNNTFKKLLIAITSLIVINILSVFVYWNVSTSYSKYSFNNSFDCGIVFFHSVTKQGALSEDSKERCNLAVKLYKNGSIKNIICVGGASLNKIGSKMMKEYILSFDIHDSIIITDSLSYSSKTNLSEANKIILNKNYKSALIISSPSHIPRLRYITDKHLNKTELGFITFDYDYSFLDIYFDCNSEFIKWIYLLFLPDSFIDYSRKILNN